MYMSVYLCVSMLYTLLFKIAFPEHWHQREYMCMCMYVYASVEIGVLYL